MMKTILLLQKRFWSPFLMSNCRDIYKLVSENLNEILNLRQKRTMKGDNSPVTEGDMLCQQLIMDYVKSIGGDYEVVSEEMDLGNFVFDENKNYIVLDPIDGTENFTSGLKEWGVSVSIYKKGKHEESMLMLPELDLCLSTGDMLPGKNQSRIRGLSSSSLYKPYRESLEEGVEYRLPSCAVYGMYNVVIGSYHSFEKPKSARSWDILAGLNLALEHGLSVYVNGEAYKGEFLIPNQTYSFKVENNNHA